MTQEKENMFLVECEAFLDEYSYALQRVMSSELGDIAEDEHYARGRVKNSPLKKPAEREEKLFNV